LAGGTRLKVSAELPRRRRRGPMFADRGARLTGGGGAAGGGAQGLPALAAPRMRRVARSSLLLRRTCAAQQRQPQAHAGRWARRKRVCATRRMGLSRKLLRLPTFAQPKHQFVSAPLPHSSCAVHETSGHESTACSIAAAAQRAVRGRHRQRCSSALAPHRRCDVEGAQRSDERALPAMLRAACC